MMALKTMTWKLRNNFMKESVLDITGAAPLPMPKLSYASVSLVHGGSWMKNISSIPTLCSMLVVVPPWLDTDGYRPNLASCFCP